MYVLLYRQASIVCFFLYLEPLQRASNGIIHVITIITIISGGWRGEGVRGLRTIKTTLPRCQSYYNLF
jgi:hypothetical protein